MMMIKIMMMKIGDYDDDDALRAVGLRRSCARAPPDPMDAEFCIHGHHYP